MIANRSETTSKDSSKDSLEGAFLDQEVLITILRQGGCPIYTFWAFQQRHGIGWDFSEESKNRGE